MAILQDSGDRRQFDSGAVRDIQEGKGRCDLLPLDVICQMLNTVTTKYDKFKICGKIITHIYYSLQENDPATEIFAAINTFVETQQRDMFTEILEVSKHYQDGAIKYGEHNWEKGIPLHCYIDSGIRHLLKYFRGDADEPHDRAFIWNMLGFIWTYWHHPELNDIWAIPEITTDNIEWCPPDIDEDCNEVEGTTDGVQLQI